VAEPSSGPLAFPLKELTLRLVSAVVLASVTLVMTWSGPVSFTVLAGVVALVLLWEWDRLTGGAGFGRATAIGGAGILVGTAIVLLGWPPWGIAALAVGVAGAAAASGEARRLARPAGVLYAGLPALALVWIRSDAELGFVAIVLLLLIVWATDTGAFVVGRLVGGPRLCPSVSPNKTWSGLAGGVATAAAVAGGYASWIGSNAVTRVVVISVGLAVVSQLGDLFESAMKRAYGVKDTSGLIPGHGGFMDRLDGLVFAVVVAAAYAILADGSAPCRVLLGLR
jgi:phosphatidate cytidylyltransferase